jgi:FkbM family methyltransferase
LPKTARSTVILTNQKIMKIGGVLKRLEPFQQKLTGKLPLCPWSPILARFDPRTLSAYPPTINISVVAEDEQFKKLRFNDLHEVWFPKQTPLTADLWSEYLAVFWSHPANGHYYLTGGTRIIPGDVCLDCGACEGFFVLQALSLGASKVVCLEPSQQMAECLKRTFSDEIKTGRVTIRNIAVGAIQGSANFTFDCLQPFGGKIESETTSVAVVVDTISRLVQDLNLPEVNFIKMDIEGAEIQAVEGALLLLTKQHPKLAITTYHRPFDFAALHALLVDVGYRQIKPVGVTKRNDRVYRPVMLHAWK